MLPFSVIFFCLIHSFLTLDPNLYCTLPKAEIKNFKRRCHLTYLHTSSHFTCFLKPPICSFSFEGDTPSSKASGLHKKLTGDEKSISSVVACTVANRPHLNAWICLASAAFGSWHCFFWSLWQCEYNSYLWRHFCIQRATKFPLFTFLSQTRISQHMHPRQETIFFTTGKGEREWARAEHHTNPARDQPRAPARRRECRGEEQALSLAVKLQTEVVVPNSSSHPAVQSHSYFCACMRADTVSRLSQSSSFAGFVVRPSKAKAGAATSTQHQCQKNGWDHGRPDLIQLQVPQQHGYKGTALSKQLAAAESRSPHQLSPLSDWQLDPLTWQHTPARTVNTFLPGLVGSRVGETSFSQQQQAARRVSALSGNCTLNLSLCGVFIILEPFEGLISIP